MICLTFLFVFSAILCNSKYTHGVAHSTSIEINDVSVLRINKTDSVSGSIKDVWFIFNVNQMIIAPSD